jgi:hypothetical protein
VEHSLEVVKGFTLEGTSLVDIYKQYGMTKSFIIISTKFSDQAAWKHETMFTQILVRNGNIFVKQEMRVHGYIFQSCDYQVTYNNNIFYCIGLDGTENENKIYEI